MAITNKSQILSTSRVANATAYLDDAIGYLNEAKENLTTAKSYASYDNFHTDQGNNFPENTELMIEALDEIISSIRTLKTNVTNKASSINGNEWAEYNEYIERKNAEAEAAASAE